MPPPLGWSCSRGCEQVICSTVVSLILELQKEHEGIFSLHNSSYTVPARRLSTKAGHRAKGCITTIGIKRYVRERCEMPQENPGVTSVKEVLLPVMNCMVPV